MNKLESTIPFDGFYESFISADIDYQIGQQIEWDCDLYDLNESEEEILYNNYLSVNTSYFYNEIAENYTNFYIEILNRRLKGFTLKAKFNLLTSPKEYKGGELCIQTMNEEKKIKLPKGEIIIYPSTYDII